VKVLNRKKRNKSI